MMVHAFHPLFRENEHSHMDVIHQPKINNDEQISSTYHMKYYITSGK
jgi:hypothetical protein